MIYLIRYGELALKSRQVRRRFLTQLEENLRSALARKGIFYNLRLDWSRAYLESDDPRSRLVLSRCFGISSFSPAERVTFSSVDELIAKGEGWFSDKVVSKRFAVRARRHGFHDFSSKDIENLLGARLLPRSGGVDLDNPEITCYVEIRDQEAWLFSERLKGPGGLPVGTGPKTLLLYSGGFDSSVSGWMIMKKGSPVDFLFFNIGGPEHAKRAKEGASFLAEEWGGSVQSILYAVEFSGIIREIRDRVPRTYWNMALKRCFYIAGAEIARRKNYPALITGESLGQVSSQTLHNLVALEAGLEIPVMRPLLGFDKEEIISLARQIGIYHISEGMKEYCDLAGGHPVTASDPERLALHTRDLDMSLVERAIASLEITQLPSAPEDADEIEIDHVPPGAVLVDLRSPDKYEAWHPEGALLLGYEEIEAGLFVPERGKPYIFYCDRALKSLDAARVIRRMGYEAYSFKGGTKALMRLLMGKG
ncbi:MAG: tRNA uracil 4-sulfurtransferase ThiI [candidate division WOR-3 bacterium]